MRVGVEVPVGAAVALAVGLVVAPAPCTADHCVVEGRSQESGVVSRVRVPDAVGRPEAVANWPLADKPSTGPPLNVCVAVVALMGMVRIVTALQVAAVPSGSATKFNTLRPNRDCDTEKVTVPPLANVPEYVPST